MSAASGLPVNDTLLHALEVFAPALPKPWLENDGRAAARKDADDREKDVHAPRANVTDHATKDSGLDGKRKAQDAEEGEEEDDFGFDFSSAKDMQAAVNCMVRHANVQVNCEDDYGKARWYDAYVLEVYMPENPDTEIIVQEVPNLQGVDVPDNCLLAEFDPEDWWKLQIIVQCKEDAGTDTTCEGTLATLRAPRPIKKQKTSADNMRAEHESYLELLQATFRNKYDDFEATLKAGGKKIRYKKPERAGTATGYAGVYVNRTGEKFGFRIYDAKFNKSLLNGEIMTTAEEAAEQLAIITACGELWQKQMLNGEHHVMNQPSSAQAQLPTSPTPPSSPTSPVDEPSVPVESAIQVDDANDEELGVQGEDASSSSSDSSSSASSSTSSSASCE